MASTGKIFWSAFLDGFAFAGLTEKLKSPASPTKVFADATPEDLAWARKQHELITSAAEDEKEAFTARGRIAEEVFHLGDERDIPEETTATLRGCSPGPAIPIVGSHWGSRRLVRDKALDLLLKKHPEEAH